MKRQTGWTLIVAFILLALLPSLPLPTSHAQTGFDRTQVPSVRPSGKLQEAAPLPASGPSDVMIELADVPTTRAYLQALGKYGVKARGLENAPGQLKEKARAAARAQRAQIERAQKNLLARLANPDIKAKVIFRVQSAYNGIAARVDAKAVGKIKGLAGVKGVYPLPKHTIDNSSSVPFIKAVNAWVASGGSAGEGIRIGIIDTGVDYTHADFGGPGTAAGYSGNDPDVVEPGTFPTAKVVGGRDFAGDAYNGSNSPVPDADPLDCNGHGTHVAGTAAGLGVNSDGTTYAGAYDATTPFSALAIGPGVAPKAQLYALKVFGCGGTTGLATQAINWAVDPDGNGDPSDHLDVINMSLGSSFGTATDASAAASDNAAAVGIIVVSSAGNSADTTYITGSPASATRAISVANTRDDGLLGGVSLLIDAPAAIAGPRAALPADFHPPVAVPSSLPGNIVQASDPADGAGPQTTDACSPLTNAAAVAGNIALIDRGTCTFASKVKRAQDAGAIGVIMVNNAPGALTMGGSDPTITIPAIGITQADGNDIKAQLGAGVSATIQFFPAGDMVSAGTSRGPRNGGAALKPDISAPGSSIISAGVGTGKGPATLSGTSMAAPHVAGAMALLRQLHPTWSVEELKALVMNTANHDLFTGVQGTGSKYAAARIGAGRIDLQDASSADVLAYSDDDAGAVSVSFGTPEVAGSTTLTRTVRVTNKGASDATYDLGYAGLSDMTGVDYSFPDGASVVVPAYGSATFRVEMTADAASMKHTRDAAMATTQAGLPRHYMSEESGYVTLTPAAGTPLRLPVYAAPRAVSNMTTESAYVLFTGATGSTAVGLTGQEIDTGNSFPVDEVSLVSMFELQETSPDDPGSEGFSNDADLKAVGVTSDYKATNSVNPNTRIFFAVVTHGQWSTPSTVTFNIFIDRDMNGTDDFQLINSSLGDGSGNPTDVFVSAIRDQPFSTPFFAVDFINSWPANLDTVPHNTNVMVIPVYASALGLTTANAKFRYRIETASRGVGGIVDQTDGYKTYDAANPGFNLTGNSQGPPLYTDLDGNTIPIGYDKANYQANASLGLLLLHHHNAFGARDQVLSVQEPKATTVTVDPASGVYSDSTTLKATVAPLSHLDQTLSGTVQFSVDGSPVGSPVAVDSGGVATASYTIGVGAGPHTVTAAFTSTNPAFLNGSNTGTLTVSKEDASVSAAASNPAAVKVGSAGGTAGPITLCFDLNEVSDASAGDTSKITSVSVVAAPIGGGASITAGAASFSGGGTNATRTACVALTSVPVNVYDVTLTINGNFYQGSGKTVLVVYDPTLGFVAGGGYVIHNGYKASFGVNIKYLKKGNAQGSLLFIEHRPDGDVVVKSNAMGAMAIVGNEAQPTGKATVGGVGNHTFIGRIIDNGEPGVNDRFGLRVTDPSGKLVIALTFEPIQLSGGNVSVPKQSGK